MSTAQASTPPNREELSGEDYTIGIICALSKELAAVAEMLDDEYPRLAQKPGDNNYYEFGRIGQHNVVIGALPSGSSGLVSAAGVALNMKSSFRKIRMGLMVGIAGQHGGVVHALHKRNKLNIADRLTQLAEKLPDYGYPSELADDLYEPNHRHQGGSSCSGCGSENLVPRRNRRNRQLPVIHYGTIASGNQVMKDAIERDRISQDLGGVLCFEMEAAGLMDDFPCLVIRGISDYSDSHKNDGWQDYAAATAAAFAKELLYHLAAVEVEQTQTINEAMGDLSLQLAKNTIVTQQTNEKIDRVTERELLDWLSPSSNFSKIQNEIRPYRVEGTGDWLIQDLEGLDWYHSGGLVWIHGVAGCGKIVLSSKIIDYLIQRCKSEADSRVAYWYFQFSSDSTQDISRMLRSLLRQLMCSSLPPRVHELWKLHHRHGTEPSHSELLDAIKDFLGVYKNVFLVFDALDEYPENKSPGRSTLLETIEQLMKTREKRPHIVVTSRREPDIREALKPMAHHSIDVDQALESDVEKFVDHALSHNSIKRWGAELISLAAQILLKSKEKRFRWTDLQIKRLRICSTAGEFRHALNTIPKSLEETYSRALETIPVADQGHVRRVLMWLTSSLREMTSSEVAAAVAFPFVRDVPRICTSVLITVIDGDTRETIKLAHFTVKEFLIIREGCEEGLHWYRFTARLANCCVTTQAIEVVFGDPPADSRNLFGYASRFWPTHARGLGITLDPASHDEVQSRVNSLLQEDHRERLLDWLRIQYPHESSPLRGVNVPLYYASLLGLERSVIHFWRDPSELKLQHGFYGNALDAAACMGHVEVVMCLTDRLETPSDYFNLAHIVQHLRVNVAETIRALLRRGCRPLISTEVVYALTKTPVGENILQILLEEDLASISITEELVRAATHNKWNRKVVEFLVRNRPHEFPLSLPTLLAIAGTSISALQMLMELRKGEVRFNEQDCLELAKEKSAHNIQKLLTVLPLAIPVTTNLIETLARAPSGSQTMEFLVRARPHEFPLSLRALLAVAGTSSSAVRMLVDLRKAEISFNEQDYLHLAEQKSASNIKKLSNLLPAAIPITTDLIGTLARSPSGSLILKILLDTQISKHPLAQSAVLMVTGGFNLETFESLLRHRWKESILTEELILSIAFNCYLSPPLRTMSSVQGIHAHGPKVHYHYRPFLVQSTFKSSSEALIFLIGKPGLKISLTQGIIRCIVHQFSSDVMFQLVETLAKTSGPDSWYMPASRTRYQLFHNLVRKIPNISPEMRDELHGAYDLMCTGYPTARERYLSSLTPRTAKRLKRRKQTSSANQSDDELEQDIRTQPKNDIAELRDRLESLKETLKQIECSAEGLHSQAAATPEPDLSESASSRLAAKRLGLKQLPETLRGLMYSTSEYEEESVIHVFRGWRTCYKGPSCNNHKPWESRPRKIREDEWVDIYHKIDNFSSDEECDDMVRETDDPLSPTRKWFWDVSPGSSPREEVEVPAGDYMSMMRAEDQGGWQTTSALATRPRNGSNGITITRSNAFLVAAFVRGRAVRQGLSTRLDMAAEGCHHIPHVEGNNISFCVADDLSDHDPLPARPQEFCPSPLGLIIITNYSIPP